MIIEIVTRVGEPPLRLEAAQILVRNDQATPIMVAGEFGGAGSVRIARVGDDDFEATLRALGFGVHRINCVNYEPPPLPLGARAIGAGR